MHRFVIDYPLRDREMVQLATSEAHHAAKVLRLKLGDEVTLLDGQGRVAPGRVTNADSHRFELVVGEVEFTPRPQYRLILAAALLKGKAWDWVLQKAAELETSTVVPLQLDRCVVRLESEGAGSERRRNDWQKTATEAAKQCGSPWITRIEMPRTLPDLLKDRSLWDVGLLASLAPGASEVKKALHAVSSPRTVVLVVGPEGDFSPSETDSAVDAGLVPVTLGSSILRAETASIVGLAIAGSELRHRWQ